MFRLPPRSFSREVMPEMPRQKTGRPVSMISSGSVQGPSSTTAMAPAHLAAKATPPPRQAWRSSPSRSITSTSPGRTTDIA